MKTSSNDLKVMFFSIIAMAMISSSLFVYGNFEENDYVLAIEEKRYEDALNIIQKKDETNLSQEEIWEKKYKK